MDTGYGRRQHGVPSAGRRLRRIGQQRRPLGRYSDHMFRRLPVMLAVVAASVVLAGGTLPRAQARPFIERLLIDSLGFSSAELAAVRRGEPVTMALPGSVDRELVLAGAIRIEAPVDRTVAVMRDIERFESGVHFLARQRLSDPPRVEDFARFTLTSGDVAALRRCRPGRCDVKLDVEAFPAVAAIDWAAADAAERANVLLRRRALAYVEGYRQRGAGAAFVYRDRERPIVGAQEFADMVTRSQPLGLLARELPGVLLQYPVARPPGTDEVFYWSVSDLGLKPVFRVHHVVILPAEASSDLRQVMATRLLYANHYFNTALDVRALIDDPAQPGRAHILVTVSLARLDGITGLLGRVARRRVREASRQSLTTTMLATRDRAQAR